MISKERFEELIKNADENSIIWGVTDYTYHKSKPNLKIDYFKLLNIPTLYKNNVDKFLKIENHSIFFETKEEAEKYIEWYLEFGNITREEKLSLPSWEELEKDLDFRTGDFWIVDNNYLRLIYDKNEFNSQIILKTKEENYNWNATKENYIEACRIARKLFLGEQV